MTKRLALLTTLLLVLTPAAARAARGETIFDPGIEVWSSPGPTLDALRSLGTDTVRLRVAYADRPELRRLDAAVTGSLARGMDVLLTPVGPAPSVAAYADFVGDLGRRYPDVHRWAIFNEPDLFPLPGHGWDPDGGPAPQPPGVLVTDPDALENQLSPDDEEPPDDEEEDEESSVDPPLARVNPVGLGREYRALFLNAQAALISAGHGPREALIGETSPVASLAFVREVLCLSRRDKRARGCKPLTAAGWAHHPYVTGIADRPWHTTKELGPADLDKLNRVLRKAARVHATTAKLAVYVTETGVNLRDWGPKAVPMLAAQEWVIHRYPFVRSYAQYLLGDDWFGTGLVRQDGTDKPTLTAFTHALFVVREGRKAMVWGHLRAEPGPATVTITDYGKVTHQVTVHTDAEGYFTITTPWRAGRRWAFDGGLPVRSYNLRR